ncbi:hypothetical protein MYXO_02847 [Myxococcaceae bacterium]|nr:hypothetical protein MYXO_02847 [Myxococcaceae bacterium]
MSRPDSRPRVRLDWIDATRAFSILWVAWFHYFSTWSAGREPWPFHPQYFTIYTDKCDPSGAFGTIACLAEAVFVGFSQLGSQAVSVFLLLSGLVLAYGLGEAGVPRDGWRVWYRQRLLRLFPMYWAAHLVWLVSPFVARPDPVDWRFVASFLGDRVWPPSLFYYAVPAWWFFGCIVQLYLVFPILAAGLRRLGPGVFLVVCAAFTIASRAILLFVLEANGNFVMGAFFGSRLWEFAAGMSIGWMLRRHREATLRILLGPTGLALGVAIYALGFLSYRPGWSFTCTDGLVGMGLFAISAQIARGLLLVPGLARPLVWVGLTSYGVYLLHQPYLNFAAERLRELPLGRIVPMGLTLLGLVTLGSGLLEKLVDRATKRVIG